MVAFLCIALSIGLFGSSSDLPRPDIDKDIPLEKALEDYNLKNSDNNPLTTDEVVAAIRNIKTNHADMNDEIYKLYRRVAEEKVLSPGMYFSRIPVLIADGYHYEVDWKDLSLTSLPVGTKDPKIGFGYNFRIRARWISSRPLTAKEVEENKPSKKVLELLEKVEKEKTSNPKREN